MTRRWDIKREKGGRWWQFWQHGRDRAARRTPSEFREMVFQGVVLGGWVRLDFLCQRHLLSSMWPTRFEPSTHTHARAREYTYTANVCLDAILRTRLYSIIKDRYWIKRDSATDFAPPPLPLTNQIRLSQCFSLTFASRSNLGRTPPPFGLITPDKRVRLNFAPGENRCTPPCWRGGVNLWECNRRGVIRFVIKGGTKTLGWEKVIIPVRGAMEMGVE